jgi:oligopeptide transport system substrate-binding protein
MAALATHFEAREDPPQSIFYLRGHPNPRGYALPNTSTLRDRFEQGMSSQDFARGRVAPPDSAPALWSDGQAVTAHDFVYSWRRVVDPQTAAPLAFWLFLVLNGEAIQNGKLSPDQLGVRALDEFTLQVKLQIPPLSFLRLLPIPTLAAVPRRVIEAARQSGRESSWTDPDRIASSGAFVLGARKPYDKTTVVRNARYYEAGLVSLEAIEFVPIANGVTTANLYRAGEVHAMPGEL